MLYLLDSRRSVPSAIHYLHLPTHAIIITIMEEPAAPHRHKYHLQKLKAWKYRNPWAFWGSLSACIILLGLGVAAAAYYVTAPAKVDTTPIKVAKKSAPPAPKFYSPLTGIEVKNEAATKQAVTAIMIENSPDARPQSGLKQAGVVYEAIAEGGITRFLAVYQEAKPQLIGPVRSVRMYYVDWAAPYNASIAHIGGSAAALAEVRNGNYRDIDQFFNAAYYWRATDRYAPHNVYTSFEKLDALNASKQYTTSTFAGFPRADGKPAASQTAKSVNMTISSALYDTHYDYDATSNTYLRSIGGQPSNDREEGRLAPAVVIAMKVAMSQVFEDGWRENITTTGSGSATVFQNGTATEATWHKNSRSEQLTFVDAAGKPIALNRGQTWITAIPNGTGSVTWQ